MKSLFDPIGPYDDPSALTVFSHCRIIRDSEHRSDDALIEAVRAPNARFFAFAGGTSVVKHERQVMDPFFAGYEINELSPDRENAVLIGHDPGGAPLLAIDIDMDTEALPAHLKAISARSAYTDGLMDAETLGALALGTSINVWARNHRFCGRCGSKTQGAAGGFRRQCTACGHLMFPRTDPVVIMMIIDEERDRCLMGRSLNFAAGRYSCLAGFVEPGETMEDAVRRETFEESSIHVGAVRFHASQPWPVPHSLMLGCYGKAESFDIQRDETELEDCRWFSREELMTVLPSCLSGLIRLCQPYEYSIQHAAP